jgi:hypothetical protein
MDLQTGIHLRFKNDGAASRFKLEFWEIFYNTRRGEPKAGPRRSPDLNPFKFSSGDT